MKHWLYFAALCLFYTADSHAADWLPPLPQWHGASEQLIQHQDQRWVTPAELTDLTDSPDYDASVAYLQALVASSPLLAIEEVGVSPQGRKIYLVKASKQQELLGKENQKPVLLAQAGIHSGEIDGKDAGFMLLRDIAHGNKSHLLDNANLLFIPILSVDGHQRRSPFNRMNQRGPLYQGWRNTAQNLNLNRDYAKADAPEMQALLAVINRFRPDLYLDIHVTDGEDYQYDITYGFNEPFASISPNGASWLAKVYRAGVDKALTDAGHIPGPLVFGIDALDFSKGISGWTASPRYSNGYGDVRHLPTVLVENHSLKPYKQRVLGTYILLEQSLQLLNEQGKALRLARLADEHARPERMVLAWSASKEPELIDFKGMSYQVADSRISGQPYMQWTGEPVMYKQLPVYWDNVPAVEVQIPAAYWIPAEQSQVLERLKVHGIETEILQQPRELQLQQLTADVAEFASRSFEGRFMVRDAHFSRRNISATLTPGYVRVSTDQALGRLAVALLEPDAPDSFFRWGFFPGMFERTEYFEPYAIEPLIAKMLAEQPQLTAEFEKALAEDEALRNNPRERYNWFYKQMPFYDQQYLKYPVLIEP
ncbi:M14 family metallopeptidase [Chromatiaceae bacterium AAb-1]|nr:M14 family metallopeptidase [Chromatiaceae bacterium AAb-1]